LTGTQGFSKLNTQLGGWLIFGTKIMKTRERILQAADELFGLVGFESATTREIVERSGVNKATLYYHFAGKEELLESLLDDYYDRLNRSLQAALLQGTDLKARLINVIDDYMDFLAENRNFMLIVQREAASGRFIERMADHLAPLLQTGEALLHDALPKTSNPTMESHHVLISFFGMIVSYFTYSDVIARLIQRDPLAGEELQKRKRHLRDMVDILVPALTGSSR
jgi:AcrR family transcriptional regulator